MKSAAPESIRDLRLTDRRRCWELAGNLGGREASVWAIEFLKAAQARTELKPGLLTHKQMDRHGPLEVALRTCQFWIGAILAVFVYLLYSLLLVVGLPSQKLPQGARRGCAVHGEWSTRTRHVLQAITDAEPPVEFIMQLGRLRHFPRRTGAMWSEHCPEIGAIEPIVPFGTRAALVTALRVPGILRDGNVHVQRAPLRIRLRETIAITFRVLDGAVSATWWYENCGDDVKQVVFGITGTADTTQLERAMQAKGTETVHVLHGQATGPNFFGISDLALFRSGWDAKQYESLQCYGGCQTQPSKSPRLKAGCHGIMVFTNLSHPMNPEFPKEKIHGDVNVLYAIAEALDSRQDEEIPRFWKPHPVIESLPKPLASELRRHAAKLGFHEIKGSDDLKLAQDSSKWIISTPSTVLIEMLKYGIIGNLIDPYESITDEALSVFPLSKCDPAALAKLLESRNENHQNAKMMMELFLTVRPAQNVVLNAFGSLK